MTDYDKLVGALRCELHYTSCPETNCKYICHDTYCDTYRLMIDAAAAIEDLQTQLPKRGEWVRKEDELTFWYVCSECGYRPHSENYPYLSDFCPNCGARM
jgi:rubrerythrin